MAKSALRARRSSTEDEDLRKLMQEAAQIWSSGTECVITHKHLLRILKSQEGCNAASSADPQEQLPTQLDGVLTADW